MTSGFSFLFDIMQLGTRSLRSPDRVIYFFLQVLHVLDYDNNSTVSDDDDDDLEVMMMMLMF